MTARCSLSGEAPPWLRLRLAARAGFLHPLDDLIAPLLQGVKLRYQVKGEQPQTSSQKEAHKMETCTTLADATATLIVAALGTEAQNHDADAIADETIEAFTNDNGQYLFRQSADTDIFWEIVAQHAL